MVGEGAVWGTGGRTTAESRQQHGRRQAPPPRRSFLLDARGQRRRGGAPGLGFAAPPKWESALRPSAAGQHFQSRVRHPRLTASRDNRYPNRSCISAACGTRQAGSQRKEWGALYGASCSCASCWWHTGQPLAPMMTRVARVSSTSLDTRVLPSFETDPLSCLPRHAGPSPSPSPRRPPPPRPSPRSPAQQEQSQRRPPSPSRSPRPPQPPPAAVLFATEQLDFKKQCNSTSASLRPSRAQQLNLGTSSIPSSWRLRDSDEGYRGACSSRASLGA